MSDVGKGHLQPIVSSAAAAARSSLVKRNDFCGSCLDGGHVRESERSPEREMEDAGLCEVAVSEQSWVPVLVQGTELLAKAWFGDTRYRVLLSDLHCVWEEEMLAEAIGSRAQELNKRLRAPVQAFFTHLRCVAEPLLSGQAGDHDGVEVPFSLLRHDDHLTVRLKSELAGVPFHWEFRLTPASVPVVCRQLVRPLLAMTRVLQRQVEELAGLLGRKDAEIQDYKENGAVLTRGRLLTDVFDEERYRQNFFSLTLPQVAAVQECVSFSPELQDLYAAVSSQRGGQRRRKRRRSNASADTHTEDDTHTPAQDQGPEHNTHTQVQDQGPEQHNTHTHDQRPDHNTHTHTDHMHEPGSRSSSDHGTTPGPGEQKNPGGGSSGEPQKSESEQTVPQMAAPVDRSVSRPKKKKAVGLFR
ncbi:non-homologous end-joining factor 1 [Clupea harengus]|uniref:Non-homologous end-joining factor 1 n=1 Tax=Clupea harengus TaxID=7950 RepID=A0A6P8ER51_CLUHA|nr:non-homologous end-joining factor 1 [Clupea harengus]